MAGKTRHARLSVVRRQAPLTKLDAKTLEYQRQLAAIADDIQREHGFDSWDDAPPAAAADQVRRVNELNARYGLEPLPTAATS